MLVRGVAPDIATSLPPGDALSPGRRLCHAYEQLQATGSRRSAGAFYTPPTVTRLTAERTLRPGLSQVVDPACGGGALLLAAAERLGAEAVHGVDLDPLAVAVARAALWLDHAPPGGDLEGISRRVVAGDALVGRPGAASFPAGQGFHWDVAFPAAHEAGGFAALVANPPYGPFPAGAPALGQRDLHYAGLFEGGRPNAFGFFLRRALDIVRPGARLGLVLPRSLLRVSAYAPLRGLLREAGHVEDLIDVGLATAGVGYEQVVVVLRLGPVPRGARTRTWRVGGEEAAAAPLGEADQLDLIRRSSIPLGLSPEGLDLVRRLEREGPPLGQVSRILRGFSVSVRDPAVTRAPAEGAVPVLRGADVWRYTVRGHAWLRLEGTRGTSGEKRRWLARPKLVLPNIVSSKIRANAAWDPDGQLALDTVTAVVPGPDAPDPHFVLAALNSALGTWLLREAIFFSARLTNHMDARYLGRFPLPSPQRSGAGAARRAAQLARDHGDCSSHEAERDAAVAEAYGLTPAEQRVVAG